MLRTQELMLCPENTLVSRTVEEKSRIWSNAMHFLRIANCPRVRSASLPKIWLQYILSIINVRS